MDICYLDHAASTPPRFFASDYFNYWANPNSPHLLGIQAHQALEQAEERIKVALGVRGGKVLFCRCASEAVEMLGHQFAEYRKFCSTVEHDSVYDQCLYHYKTNYIDDKTIREEDIYLHQHVNHITGKAFDIKSVGKKVQSTGAFFGSDITASLGHYPLPSNLYTFFDALWFSGRKTGCETMGAIWLSDRLFYYLLGDEVPLIKGTPNTPGAIALSYAVEKAVENVDKKNELWKKLVHHLLTELDDNGVEAYLWDDGNPYQTYAINAINLPGMNSDVLVQFLSNRGVFVSPCHSACSDQSDYRVAEALGMTEKEASESIRVSFGEGTGYKDINKLIEGITKFKEVFV